MSKLLPMDQDWTFKKLELFDNHISEIAKEDFLLDTYENQIEVINSHQMIEAYSSNGIPLNYSHWSFGKKMYQMEEQYKQGQMGLAYEIVINTNPVISYLMEENPMYMQALVIAHACYGHNAFFKNNYLFKERTEASEILNYMEFAKNYIKECEIKYGEKEVELFLDSCHSLSDFGVDHYKKKQASELSVYNETSQDIKKRSAESDEFWNKIFKDNKKSVKNKINKFPKEPEENLLYFFEKYAPNLDTWQRELLRITRKISEYFYPQRQTQVSNEGFASFMHYNIMYKMFDKGLINSQFMLPILKSHTDVVFQPAYNDPRFSGRLNPYALGFAIYQDIKRMCEEPTKEDEYYFPSIVGKDFRKEVNYAMSNFRDESFILQYLSPKVIRDLGLFTLDIQKNKDYIVDSVANERGYNKIKKSLAKQMDIGYTLPKIEITDIDILGDRTLTLRYNKIDNMNLDNSNDNVNLVLKHIKRIWGFKVILESYNPITSEVENVFYI